VIDVENWGADATKLGAGLAKVRITKLKPGFGTGSWLLNAQKWCACVANKPIIADGGPVRDRRQLPLGDPPHARGFGCGTAITGVVRAVRRGKVNKLKPQHRANAVA
jgi:hypothetical protein